MGKLFYIDLSGNEPKPCEGFIVQEFEDGYHVTANPNGCSVRGVDKAYPRFKDSPFGFGSPSRDETLAKFRQYCQSQIAEHERAVDKLRSEIQWAELMGEK